MADEQTIYRGYPIPVAENWVSDDVTVLRAAFTAIDVDVQGILTQLGNKAPLAHTHSIENVSGLQAAIDSKAASGHNHAFDALNGVSVSGAADGMVLVKQGASWIAQAPAFVLGNHSHSVSDVVGLQATLDGKLTEAALAAAASKASPVDADTIPLTDSAASNGLRKLSWSNIKAALKTYFDTLYAPASIQTVPAGSVLDFAGATAPSGYLLCYGQAVSRTTYAALFTAIGTAHGAGDGSTTFNLPDYRGRVGAGKDDMGGVSANRLTLAVSGGVDGDVLGGTGGAETHVLTTAQMPSHSHSGTTNPGGAHTPTLGTSSTAGAGSRAAQGTSLAGNVNANAVPDHTHAFTTAAAGSDAAHNNIQPTLILNKIIKT